MKCRNCGFENESGLTNCKRCNTMLRPKSDSSTSGSKRALFQVFLLVAGMVAVVVILWLVMHDLFHVI